MGFLRTSWNHFIIAERENFFSRAAISLGVSVAAAVAGLFAGLVGGFLAYGVCGDLSSDQCGPQPWTAYLPAEIFLGLAAIAALVAVVSLVRALVLFAFAAVAHMR
jgi:hypothetical protein